MLVAKPTKPTLAQTVDGSPSELKYPAKDMSTGHAHVEATMVTRKVDTHQGYMIFLASM